MKSTGYIVNGVYHKEVPNVESLANKRAITDKSYDHDRQRENHRRDLIQPTKNGRINPEFVEQYPDIAKERGMI